MNSIWKSLLPYKQKEYGSMSEFRITEIRLKDALVLAYQSIVDEYEKDTKSEYFSSSGGMVDLASFAQDKIKELEQGE